ncbi:E3 ubiquitin-protein ligase CHFR-like [Onthophagus taurus]|uniref:E3 ubiquitin-protein ligase CHFR-like n=1 Tax=Onthophagus taurus TaxID=166361 RepID=UPI0039BEBE77
MCTEQSAYIQDSRGIKLDLRSNEEFTIGRALNRSLTIEDLRISRTHCRFKEVNGVWNVVNESVNGTIVNGNRIPSKQFHVLSNGDILKLTEDIFFTFFASTPNVMGICDIVDKIETEHHYNTRSNSTSNTQLIENVTNGQEKVGYEKDKEGAGEASDVAGKVVEPVSEKVETELQCSICTELFVKAQTLNCSHTFCNSCIQAWKRKNYICPICRAKIKTITPTIVLDNLVNTVIEASSEEIKKNRQLLLQEREKLPIKRLKNDSKFKRTRRSVRSLASRGTSGSTNSAGVTRNLRASTRGSTAAESAPPEAIWISSSDSDSESDEYSTFDFDLDTDSETMDTLLSNLDDIMNDDANGSMFSAFYSDGHSEYVPGNPEVYYGGYGSCFRCGARGHWANGCPLR